MPELSPFVFVYGTLMPGEQRWVHLLPFAESWEPVKARGELWDTGRGYPAARFDESAGVIPGFLVAIDHRRISDAVAILDEIEEEGLLYRRIEVATSGGTGFSYEWLGPTDGFVRLTSGWPPRV